VRVLVSAYACEPGKGSEPGVGWNWVRQLAKFNEIWVLTRANNRERIEAALIDAAPSLNVHFVYYDLPAWARWWKRGGFGTHIYYVLWQLGIYFVAKRLHRQVAFDLIHHITFVNYWMPTFLALLHVPFIWGPVGGGESAPKDFRCSFTLHGKSYEFLRDFARSTAYVNPLVRLTAQRAVSAFATTVETEEKLRSLGCSNVSLLSQIALPNDEIEYLCTFPICVGRRPFRIVSLGRFIHWKGFAFALLAFAELHRRVPDSEYWLIGDGPERKRLEQLAQTLEVADHVRFLGALPRAHALERLSSCDVLLHPSLHDSGGYACLESMAAGRPVICLDLSGPAIQVTSDTGIKVPAETPQQVVRDLTAALNRLAAEPALRLRLGEAGRRRVAEDFSWEKKGEWMSQIYPRARNEFGTSRPTATTSSAEC
jgi:glycosyltransferase involved in cell wall biosynthesis